MKSAEGVDCLCYYILSFSAVILRVGNSCWCSNRCQVSGGGRELVTVTGACPGDVIYED